MVLFRETLSAPSLKWLEGLLCTGATLALLVGLTYFLREVHLANRTVRLETRSPGTVPDLNGGSLSPAEARELEDYKHIGRFLELMQSRARFSLKNEAA